jgi:hypothetical protein
MIWRQLTQNDVSCLFLFKFFGDTRLSVILLYSRVVTQLKILRLWGGIIATDPISYKI